MKKLNEKMIDRYGEIYKRMYDNDEDTYEKSKKFDELMMSDEDFKELVMQYGIMRFDMLISDRECAAFYEMYNED